MKTILLIYTTVAFISYLIFISRLPNLKSISQSFYRLRAMGGYWYTLFFVFILSVAFPLAIIAENEIMTLAAGLLCVGVLADPIYADGKWQGIWHYIGATSSITLGFVYQWTIGLFWPTAIMLVGSIVIATVLPNIRIRWIEVLAIVLIILGMALNLNTI